MESRVIHLKDRRVIAANLNDLFTSVIAAFGVLGAASSALPADTAAEALLAAGEVLLGVALLAAIVGELRELRAGVDRDGARISWLHLFAGAVLVAECVQSYHDRGRVPRPAAVTAAITLALAFLQPRIKRRLREQHSLRLGDAGVELRLGKFRRFSARWEEIAELRREGATLHVRLRDGRTRALRFRSVTNRDEAFAALASGAAERGIAARALAAG